MSLDGLAEEVTMRNIYLAGPLFSDPDKNFLRGLSETLRHDGYDVLWPGDLLSDDDIRNAGDKATKLIFESCRKALEGCDCVVALLDGTQVDDGTSWEIGYAYAKGMPIYGLRTDTRRVGDSKYSKVNSMIQGCLIGLAKDTGELLALLR